ncbi:MAG: hypothetical protein HY649_05225 [Acidobacteria bacterium]|nr:hypothetical protein [Acidobacteriota bacterium]
MKHKKRKTKKLMTSSGGDAGSSTAARWEEEETETAVPSSSEFDDGVQPPLREPSSTSGVWDRMAHWWRELNQPVVSESFIPRPESPQKMAARESGPSEREMLEAEAQSTPAAEVDRVIDVPTLKRTLPELESARRELAEYEEQAEARIRQLETERDLSRAEVVGAREQRRQAETRAGMLERSLEAMEHRLHEERGSFEERVRQCEKERDQLRADLEIAQAERQPLDVRWQALEAQLEAAHRQLSEMKEAGAMPAAQPEARAGDSRLHALEEELEGVRQEASTQSAAFQEQLHQLQDEREQVASQLAAREQETLSLRQSARLMEATARSLEQALQETQERLYKAETGRRGRRRKDQDVLQEKAGAYESEAALSQASAGGATSMPHPAAMAADLYERSVMPLTVLMATADLLLLNPQFESAAQEAVRDIKTQGQKLLEIIQEYTQPPQPKQQQQPD